LDRSIHHVILKLDHDEQVQKNRERFHNKSGSARLFMGLQHGVQYNEIQKTQKHFQTGLLEEGRSRFDIITNKRMVQAAREWET